MTEKLQPPRGTQDLIGDEYRRHAHIIQTAQTIAHSYGYEPIATPIFESTAVFKRTIGETSDIVGKEMYTFEDRGGEEVTLRPEGTAGTLRAVISNGLTQHLPLKLIYSGPMFRYERPQLGRRRQFHQLGVECLGIAHPYSDVETIALGTQVLKALGVLEKTTLEINTLGDTESRQNYRQALIDYFTPYQNQLSKDSQDRLLRNPLRILDSKDEGDRALVANAPQFENYLNETSSTFFAQVCQGLDALNISYQINRRLVRGLDYYNHTAFEFVTTELGAQGTVLAGGRYDGLMSQMGGPETPGIGWALGIERLALLLPALDGHDRPIAVIPVGEAAFSCCFNLTMQLRDRQLMTDIAYSGNVGKRLKRANKINARYAIMIGDEELTTSQAIIKDLDTGEQKLVAISEISDYLSNLI
ncbi:histidine--tRNA ligase [Candidatus Odyssella thessalonicensis]|uniref:histidine--tRNA ligase n=1 Tax=Candidatus Odyssella thessalonicensis TaxID=84647 RepID=UPI000225B1BA|nr:histidine--tRNA ligase [Candidatus Odyssella thessalonicensis]